MSGGQVAMVVDDEDLVREVTAMMLEDSGFEVIEAQTGDEALEKFSANIAIAVLDFSMPGMTGYQLALKLRGVNSRLPIVMMSGLGMIDDVRKLQTQGGLEFVSKPFDQAALLKSVRRALEWAGNGEE